MVASPHVLLVDDDPKFRDFVASGLRESRVDCTVAANASQAVEIVGQPRATRFDVILLDIMMPELTGWDLLKELRARGVETPVIFVTAREAVDERVRGLELGADDYVIKPFAFSELLARIHAVLRRRRVGRELRIGDAVLLLDRRIVWRAGKLVDLSPKEFDLLRMLVEARGRVVSRREILREVWMSEHDPGTNVVDVHVGRLRRKLGVHGAPLIQTVRNVGYVVDDAGGTVE